MSGRGGGFGRSRQGRSRSPPRRRSRDRRNPPPSQASRSEEQARLREMLIREAAQRNPDAANVFSGKSSVQDQEAMQRALSTANSLGVTHAQNQHFLQQQQQHQQQYQQRQGGGGGAYRGGGSSSLPQRNPARSAGQGGAPADKIFYELHIGGLSEAVHDEPGFAQFLNEICVKKGINTEPGNPITSVRINSAGRFAFAMFRSKEEATRGLELTSTVYMGNALRVERPRGYKQLGSSQMNNATAALAPMMDEAQLISAVLANTPPPTLPGFTREQLKQALEQNLDHIGPSSSLVQLANLFGATVDEVELEARKYGQVMGVRTAGEGAFWVKMSSLQEAERLVQMRKMYDNRRVDAVFLPASEWQQ